MVLFMYQISRLYLSLIFNNPSLFSPQSGQRESTSARGGMPVYFYFSTMWHPFQESAGPPFRPNHSEKERYRKAHWMSSQSSADLMHQKISIIGCYQIFNFATRLSRVSKLCSRLVAWKLKMLPKLFGKPLAHKGRKPLCEECISPICQNEGTAEI